MQRAGAKSFAITSYHAIIQLVGESSVAFVVVGGQRHIEATRTCTGVVAPRAGPIGICHSRTRVGQLRPEAITTALVLTRTIHRVGPELSATLMPLAFFSETTFARVRHAHLISHNKSSEDDHHGSIKLPSITHPDARNIVISLVLSLRAWNLDGRLRFPEGSGGGSGGGKPTVPMPVCDATQGNFRG